MRSEVSGTFVSIISFGTYIPAEEDEDLSDRSKNQLSVEEADLLDFDKAMLPEDSWARLLDEDEFEVEKITDVRSGMKTRFGKIQRQYLVQWKGSGDPKWTDEEDLNCGDLLQNFNRDRVSKNVFEVTQSHEAAVDE